MQKHVQLACGAASGTYLDGQGGLTGTGTRPLQIAATQSRAKQTTDDDVALHLAPHLARELNCMDVEESWSARKQATTSH